MDYRVRRSWIGNARPAVFLMYGILALPLMHSGLRAAPEANFYLTHPFLDLVSGRSSNWQTAHAQVGGVQPLNLEAN